MNCGHRNATYGDAALPTFSHKVAPGHAVSFLARVFWASYFESLPTFTLEAEAHNILASLPSMAHDGTSFAYYSPSFGRDLWPDRLL